MSAHTTTAIGLAAWLAAAALAVGCGDDKDADQGKPGGAVQQAQPREKVEIDRRPKARGRGAKVLDEELFTAKVEALSGKVEVRARSLEPLRGGSKGALVYGGGEIVTGEDGRAEVSVREVGVVTLDRNSALSISRYSECGAILLRGAALLQGPRRVPKRPRCFLHTPAAAVWSPRGQSVIGVAPDGATRLATVEGGTQYANLLGAVTDVPAGKQVELDLGGKGPRESALSEGQGPREAWLRPWLEKVAEQQPAAGPRSKKLLDSAGRVAKRLELDVERLLELMELNRKASAARKDLMADAGADDEQVAKLTADLTEQAVEMTDLQIKGNLQIHRIISLVELARGTAEDGGGTGERIAEIEARLEELAGRLPPLFEKKRKVSGTAGQIPKLMPAGPPPKPPK